MTLLLLLATGCAPRPARPAITLRMAGAQIPVELVESWLGAAKDYRFRVERAEFPTWSQRGFEVLAGGDCELACSDRLISPRERQRFGGQDVVGYRVAFYGYALYVHPDNRLDSIFSRHIKMVFRKQINDWKQLAGEEVAGLEGPITLYGPVKNSRAGLILMQQANIWFADPTWTALESESEIIDRVAADPYALGFASVGYSQGRDVRPLGIRTKRTGRPAFPSLEEIEDERYGLAKVIYVYCRAPASPIVQTALDYLYSEQGRSAIEATDVWPIARERAETRSVR